MKTFTNAVTALLFCIAVPAIAQTDKVTTQKIVHNQDFVFVATSAMPLSSQDISAVLNKMNNGNGSGSINLTGSRYDLSIQKDSVVAFLPYYGRSYTASLNPDDAGIKFKSKDFTYQKVNRKKGGWNITIIPNDIKDHQKLTLSVSTSGYATLNVINNNRQPITFNGYLAERVEKKSKP